MNVLQTTLCLLVLTLTACTEPPEPDRAPVGEGPTPSAPRMYCDDAYACVSACRALDFGRNTSDARIDCVDECDQPPALPDEIWLSWAYSCAEIGRHDDVCDEGLDVCQHFNNEDHQP